MCALTNATSSSVPETSAPVHAHAIMVAKVSFVPVRSTFPSTVVPPLDAAGYTVRVSNQKLGNSNLSRTTQSIKWIVHHTGLKA